jgi:hypothetical protein
MSISTAKQQTFAGLRQLQRLAGAVIMRELAPGWRMQKRWTDGRDMRRVAASFIKPNDRLSSFERIEIYNKQYWFRLVDCMDEDFPGLKAVLGKRRFFELVKAYLKTHPSRSFTLRNLASRLPRFIQQNPKFVRPRLKLALDMARFEWAQVVAFDGPACEPIGVDDLLGKDPDKLRLSLQPYVQPLALRYPLDEFVQQLKQDAMRGDASNAMDESREDLAPKRRGARLPRAKNVFVVVHRHENSLYYKRLEGDGFKLLTELGRGRPLSKALATAMRGKVDPAKIRGWFATWSQLGWLCLASK